MIPILGLLFGAGVAKCLYELIWSDYKDTGIKCKLCGWQYRVGEHYSYSVTAQQEAKRLFKLHVKDVHPNING